jgi:hypothetical protein
MPSTTVTPSPRSLARRIPVGTRVVLSRDGYTLRGRVTGWDEETDRPVVASGLQEGPVDAGWQIRREGDL